jgi:TRAP transporter TAXI family solute receptor
MGWADAVEAMKNEMIVGLGKTSVPDSSILDIASAMKIRIFSLTDSEVEKIVRNIAGLRKVVVPAGMYPGVGEFKTFEDEVCDVVRTDFPSELTYKMVKTVWENRAEITRVYKSSSSVMDRFPTVTMGVTTPQIYLHPGAVKFYRELGLTVPKNLIPPEMGEK